MNDLFFFYGSLRSGYWNQRVLRENPTRLGNSTTVLPFELYVGSSLTSTVPTVVPGAGKVPLHGELYRLSKNDALSVYRLETGYKDGQFEVTCEGRRYMAHIFHHDAPQDCSYLRGGYVLVPRGDYTDVVRPDGHKVTF